MTRVFGGSPVPGNFRFIVIAAGIALAGSVLSTPAAKAQDTVIIGGGGRPAVEVNLDALNDIGRASPIVRRLRMPGQTSRTAIIVLRPPGGPPLAGAAAPTLRRPAAVPAPRPPVQVARPPVQVRRPAAPPPAVETARVTPPPAPRTTVETTAATPPPPPPAAVETTAAPTPAPARVETTRRPPPPPPAPARAAPAPRETQTAAVAPRAALPEGGGQALRVVFSGSSTRLTNDAAARLDQLAAALLQTEDRIQLKAFAGGSADRPSTARRLSLSRALAVRSHLIEAGLRSTRIDVRALGVPGDDGPTDRVDVILLTQ
jgi:outer membrane protein OmpA-like peptidoglycan-associated protein